MKLGVIKESEAHECRVALVPETVKKLSAKGFSITIEARRVPTVDRGETR